MEKLIETVTKVISALNEAGVEVECDDSNYDEHLEYVAIEGIEVIVNDDSWRGEWSVVLTAKGDKVRPALEKALDAPTSTHDNGSANWDGDVLVVSNTEGVEFYQAYRKVAARSSR